MFSGAALSGVRTFLDPAKAEPRLPDQPEALSSYPPGAGASTWGRLGKIHHPTFRQNLTETSRDWDKSRCEKRQNDIKIGGYSPILEESS